MRDVFERAILDQPDEPSNYAAYADWLHDEGDPRGEFIQVQLALEDASVGPRERAAMNAREKELLDQHERAWLGSLAAHLLDGDGKTTPRVKFGWRRGFLSSIRAQCLTMGFAHSLVDEPAARFLDELRVFGPADFYGMAGQAAAPSRIAGTPGVFRGWELLELIDAPCLRNLRIFQMGDTDGDPPEDGWSDCHTYAPGLELVVAGMPRVEELHLLCKEYDVGRLFALPNLNRLRVLRLLHLGVGDSSERGRQQYPYPLDVLAGNPAFASLTHLLFHPHTDEYHSETYREQQDTRRRPSFLPLEQVRALVNSPHLPKLIHLQLRLSNMGDAGVRAIIDSGILARLKHLDLRHGCITDAGARMFASYPNMRQLDLFEAPSDTRRLESLDLSRNAVSAEGLRSLIDAGISARADNPLTPEELAGEEYLFEGDSE